jgi:hypothetical protein
VKMIRLSDKNTSWIKTGRPRRLIEFGRAVCLLMFGIGIQCATAQDLVINGAFDQNVSAWENPNLPAATWSSLDASGSADSGSAQLLNNSSAAGTRLYILRQCLVLSQSGQYRVEATGLASAQGAGGRLVVSRIDHRIGAECSGSQTVSGGFFIEATGSWQHDQMALQYFDATSSIELLIGIEKDAAGGNFVAQVDDVKLVLMPLFASGFEYGFNAIGGAGLGECGTPAQ